MLWDVPADVRARGWTMGYCTITPPLLQRDDAGHRTWIVYIGQLCQVLLHSDFPRRLTIVLSYMTMTTT